MHTITARIPGGYPPDVVLRVASGELGPDHVKYGNEQSLVVSRIPDEEISKIHLALEQMGLLCIEENEASP